MISLKINVMRVKRKTTRNNTVAALEREPTVVDPEKVRRTNFATVSQPWNLPDVPIVVIKSGECLYIVDGNHRFVADCKQGRPVKAWILTAKDRKHLTGSLPCVLREWVEGSCTFARLRSSAVDANKAYERGLTSSRTLP
jgi:hypothetical protein